MMNRTNIVITAISTLLLALLSSCGSGDSLSPGIEYMPDMYRTPSIEEYVDYGEIRDRINDSIANKLSAMVPPQGTIIYSKKPSEVGFNFPYPYPNTQEGYNAASNNLHNPLEFTEEVYNEGKRIYGVYCVHCHGAKGDGQGSIVQKGVFPPPPAYSRIKGLNDGRMFHTLMYGKGNMGSHAAQLSKKELWTVAHYVRTLRDEKSDFASAAKVETAVDVEVDNNIND